MRVRTVEGVCKPLAQPRQRRLLRLSLCCGALGMLIACQRAPESKTITMATLENAPPAASGASARVVVSDAAALRDLCTPLGPRLGLLQIRSEQDWARLTQTITTIGRRPDLRAGTVIGVACWAGTPVDGEWPVEIDTVQVHEGAGLMTASFRGGTYLPDGTASLETAYVKGLVAVLAVDVNGTTFFPD